VQASQIKRLSNTFAATTPSVSAGKSAVLLLPDTYHEIEAFTFAKRLEVPVPCRQRYPAIDATLWDQCIAKARLSPFPQRLRSQGPGPLPGFISISGNRVSVSATSNAIFGSLNNSVKTTGAIKTCLSSSALSKFGVFTVLSLKVGDPRTRVSGDHRSAFSSFEVCEENVPFLEVDAAARTSARQLQVRALYAQFV
jgi:hypothetical protein